eukprot:3699185-Rhodomonas_salina.1
MLQMHFGQMPTHNNAGRNVMLHPGNGSGNLFANLKSFEISSGGVPVQGSPHQMPPQASPVMGPGVPPPHMFPGQTFCVRGVRVVCSSTATSGVSVTYWECSAAVERVRSALFESDVADGGPRLSHARSAAAHDAAPPSSSRAAPSCTAISG